MPVNPIDIHLPALITHHRRVNRDTPLGEVYETLTAHDIEFVAVIDGERLVGVLNRTRLGATLGQRYGYALFAREPAHKHLAPVFLEVSTATPVTEVLSRAFSRGEEHFYDDVVLTDVQGRFLGFIEMRALVVLQNRFFVETIDRLEAQQAELNHKNRQMENDLFLARQVQQALLPQEYPVYPPGVDAPRSQIRFHHLYRSADLLGGDFFHVVHLAEARFGVFICDVMGHGVGSALVTSMMRASLENHLAVSAAPGALLAKINHDLCRMLRNHPHALFATAAYLVLDIAAQRLQFASAGHPIPLRIAPHINACRELPLDPQAVGTPLGIVDRADYGTGECPMQPGDRIVLYTDGLYEMTNAAGEVFGSERLKVSLARNRRLAGPDLLASVLEAIGKFAAEPEFADDICAVVVAYGVGEDL